MLIIILCQALFCYNSVKAMLVLIDCRAKILADAATTINKEMMLSTGRSLSPTVVSRLYH